MAINYESLAKDLLVAVGGKENVANVVHCATRLRFKLKDDAKASAEQAKKLVGVVTVVEKAGQFQVVIGNTVPEVYKEVVKAGDFDNMTDSGDTYVVSKGNLLDRLVDTIAGVFPPILGAICGGGLIKGLLAIAIVAGWLTPDTGTYIVLNAAGDAVFYFLPIMLGFSAGRKFGGNPYLTALVGATLLYPSIVGLAGQQITFLRLPMAIMNYSSSVIPILLAAYACCVLERFFNKRLHVAIKNFVTPMLCLLVVVPLTLFIIGPVCMNFSDLLAKGYQALPPVLGGTILGGFWQVLVIFGMHWGFVPLMFNNMNTLGIDPILTIAQVGALSQTGAAFGMFLKMKNKDAKGMTFSGVLSGIFGITEAIIYGVTLPRKKPFIMGAIGAAIGGAVSGLIGGASYSMGAFGILALPTTIDPVNGIGAPFWGTLFGMLTAFVIAALLNFITYKDDTMVAEGPKNAAPQPKPAVASAHSGQEKLVYSPMNGKVVSLSESKDPVHQQEVLGTGVLILPEEGKVYAPFDGTVAIVYDTLHAIGLVSDEGVELLIHVGMDTVSLDGKYFKAHVGQNDRVRTGQLLLEFDAAKLREEGFELESPIIVTNTPDYSSVERVSGEQIKKADKLLAIH